jgi:hypothetical protein
MDILQEAIERFKGTYYDKYGWDTKDHAYNQCANASNAFVKFLGALGIGVGWKNWCWTGGMTVISASSTRIGNRRGIAS